MRITLRYCLCVIFSMLSVLMIIGPTMAYGSINKAYRNLLWLFIIPVALCFFIAVLCAANVFPFTRNDDKRLGGSDGSVVVAGSRRSHGVRSNRIESVDDEFFYVSGDRIGTQGSRSTSMLGQAYQEPDTRYHSTRITSSRSDVSGFRAQQVSDSTVKPSHSKSDVASRVIKVGSHPDMLIVDQALLLQQKETGRGRNYTVDVGSDCGEGNSAVLEALAIHEDVPQCSPTSRKGNCPDHRPWRSLEKRRTMPENIDMKAELEKSNSWPQAYTKALLEVKRNLDTPLQLRSEDTLEDGRRAELPLPKTGSRDKVKDWLFDQDYCVGQPVENKYGQFAATMANISNPEKPKSDKPNKFVILGRGYFYACETDDYVRVESPDAVESPDEVTEVAI